MTSGDGATRGEPEFWVERKKRISRVDIHEKRDVRVGRRREFLYNDGVTFVEILRVGLEVDTVYSALDT